MTIITPTKSYFVTINNCIPHRSWTQGPVCRTSLPKPWPIPSSLCPQGRMGSLQVPCAYPESVLGSTCPWVECERVSKHSPGIRTCSGIQRHTFESSKFLQEEEIAQQIAGIGDSICRFWSSNDRCFCHSYKERSEATQCERWRKSWEKWRVSSM